ncbi:MAG: LysE family transporter [Bacteroidales bacterium]|nr:LysE family transporter [Bacteroidales bacterium]
MIIIAFVLGLIIAIPLGPLGQMMLNRAINKSFWHGFSIAILASIADFIFCEFFLIGTVSIGAISPWIKIIFQAVGLIFISYIGVKEFIMPLIKSKLDKTHSTKTIVTKEKFKFGKKLLFQNIVMVGSYNISNPMVFAFWLSFSVLINQKFIFHHDLLHYTLFSLFFAFGTLTCQYISILFVKKIGVKKDMLKYMTIPLYSIALIYFAFHVTQNILQII